MSNSRMSWRAAKLTGVAFALLIVAAPFQSSLADSQESAFSKPCRLESFTGRAQKSGWIVQELTDEERVNFLNHLNHDNGQRTNFYPPHVWETVQKKDDLIHIRVVFLDRDNCVLGNSGEIGFNELSYLLAPDTGF